VPKIHDLAQIGLASRCEATGTEDERRLVKWLHLAQYLTPRADHESETSIRLPQFVIRFAQSQLRGLAKAQERNALQFVDIVEYGTT
jgi:hypothetical protein